jgi:hypothetical protein
MDIPTTLADLPRKITITPARNTDNAMLKIQLNISRKSA